MPRAWARTARGGLGATTPSAAQPLSSGSVRGVRICGSLGVTCGRTAPRELAESVRPAQPRAPSRALSGSRVPSAEPDLARQELRPGHAQPGPQAALLCLTSAEPMCTNSCCPSSDEHQFDGRGEQRFPSQVWSRAPHAAGREMGSPYLLPSRLFPRSYNRPFLESSVVARLDL